MKITDLLLTIYLWTITAFAMLVTYTVCLISYPFISQKSFSRLYEYVAGYIILYCMVIPGFWTVTINDYRRNKSWDNKRYVIVGNHISFIDSLMGILIPLKKKFMMARMFTKIPVFGWITLSSGYIPVDRNDKNSTHNSVDKAIETMKDGCSFMIFPEGKRTKGDLEKFKTGAFRIAQKTKVPILPIALKNTNKAMGFGGIVSTADIVITIGEPYYVEEGWENIEKSIDVAKNFISKYN